MLKCIITILISKRPVNREFKIIYPFWKDATNEKNSRSNAYFIFDNHHPGADFGMPENNDVYASFDGIVVRKEFHEGMGNVVGVRNGNIIALYAHLNKLLIELGDIVKTGQVLGLSGNTGKATIPGVPHLHFELRDIIKPSLKEMVFKPIFNKPIKQFKENFAYTVFNQNTKKTLKFLALRYFGEEEYWEKILNANSDLNLNPDEVIKEGIEVLIPNY